MDTSSSPFESTVDAIISGDLPKLEQLLRDHPALIHERSTREHHATLLHYIGANGVEQYRQKTPPNAVQICATLLRAGADIHAIGDMYGGSTTLGLVATSVHPFLVGVQNDLIDILLAHGATFDTAVAPNYTSGSLITACLANGRGRAAEHLVKHDAPLNLESAAGVGHLDLVQTFFNDDGTLKSTATTHQLECGFMWACQYGRTHVVEFLLRTELKIDAMPRGETGLHWAAYTARTHIIKLLLQKHASFNLKDKSHNGTPLGWALYAWCESPLELDSPDYYETISLLVAAGATEDPAWLAHPHRDRLILEKTRSDPRMIAALNGKIPLP